MIVLCFGEAKHKKDTVSRCVCYTLLSGWSSCIQYAACYRTTGHNTEFTEIKSVFLHTISQEFEIRWEMSTYKSLIQYIQRFLSIVTWWNHTDTVAWSTAILKWVLWRNACGDNTPTPLHHQQQPEPIFWFWCVKVSWPKLTGVASGVVFCCCSPSASRTDVSWDALLHTFIE